MRNHLFSCRVGGAPAVPTFTLRRTLWLLADISHSLNRTFAKEPSQTPKFPTYCLRQYVSASLILPGLFFTFCCLRQQKVKGEVYVTSQHKSIRKRYVLTLASPSGRGGHFAAGRMCCRGFSPERTFVRPWGICVRVVRCPCQFATLTMAYLITRSPYL